MAMLDARHAADLACHLQRACRQDSAVLQPEHCSLQDSLGGGAKVVMVVTVSPEAPSAGQSLCSLQFASRVRGMTLGCAACSLPQHFCN